MSVSNLSILLLSATFLVAQPLLAGSYRDRHDAERAYGITLDNAVNQARERYKGRVISAETDRQNGRGTYKIRILTDDGHVKRLQIDPETGEYIWPDYKKSGRSPGR
jgi:hypothetical protein